jgi:glutamate-1-semialdehyde aminotransferase
MKYAFAQGSVGTNSKRHDQYPDNFPAMLSHGEKCYVYDKTTNKRYCDFISGLGSIILGYSNTAVIESVSRQAIKGSSFSLPNFKEIEAAEKIKALFHVEKIRFGKNGKDASEASIRIARAYTGRQIVLSRGYHGCSDIFTSLTPPALGIKDEFWIYKLSDDLNEIEKFGDSIACVIVEAIELSSSDKWRDWLRSLREICNKKGIVFIIDEIITGCRVPEFSASRYWDLKPDIMLLGKAIANGYPLSVVGGKREIMDCGEYFISSTFSGEAVSLAACEATLHEIETRKSLDDLQFYGTRLMNKLNELHPDIKFEGYGTRASLNLTNPTTAAFSELMCEAGYLFGKAWFFNFAHMEENIEALVMPVAHAVIDKIKNGYKLKGRLPAETFIRKTA